jgi:hypothetical protein
MSKELISFSVSSLLLSSSAARQLTFLLCNNLFNQEFFCNCTILTASASSLMFTQLIFFCSWIWVLLRDSHEMITQRQSHWVYLSYLNWDFIMKQLMSRQWQYSQKNETSKSESWISLVLWRQLNFFEDITKSDEFRNIYSCLNRFRELVFWREKNNVMIMFNKIREQTQKFAKWAY